MRVDKSLILHDYALTFHNMFSYGDYMHKPWELNSQLKREYLITMAQFIAEVRADVVDLHNVEVGDTNRVLGYRAYECCRSRIISESASGRKPWLRIINEDYRFTFAIGGTPVRFYRGKPETPEERRLIPSIESMQQMSLLAVDEPGANIIWFFVVQTDELKLAEKVTFAGFEHGQCVCMWDIPLEEEVDVPSVTAAEPPKAVVQKPVTLVVKKKDRGLDEEATNE